jgi:hypothetical protein
MPMSYAQFQQSLTFDELMKTLNEQIQTIPDNRSNAVQYQLPDVLKAAFAMFSLKSPSLLDFKTQTTAEEKNLHNDPTNVEIVAYQRLDQSWDVFIFEPKGSIPVYREAGTRRVIDRIFDHLRKQGVCGMEARAQGPGEWEPLIRRKDVPLAEQVILSNI